MSTRAAALKFSHLPIIRNYLKTNQKFLTSVIVSLVEVTPMFEGPSAPAPNLHFGYLFDAAVRLLLQNVSWHWRQSFVHVLSKNDCNLSFSPKSASHMFLMKLVFPSVFHNVASSKWPEAWLWRFFFEISLIIPCCKQDLHGNYF